MNTAETDRVRSTALDALSAICASERGDYASVAVTVNAIAAEGKLAEFCVAVIGHAGNLLKLASHAAGCSPDKIAGGVAMEIRERP